MHGFEGVEVGYRVSAADNIDRKQLTSVGRCEKGAKSGLGPDNSVLGPDNNGLGPDNSTLSTDKSSLGADKSALVADLRCQLM
jgi:hypothetical protein